MTDNKVARIQAILTDVDDMLCKKLSAAGVEIPYLFVAVAPDGTALVRGNVAPEDLAKPANEVEEAASEGMLRPPGVMPIN